MRDPGGREGPKMTEHATGARHPITDNAEHPWEISYDLHAWMSGADPTGTYTDDRGPFVTLEDAAEGALIVIPNNLLALLARGLIAAHVDSGRTDRWSG
jgi:hypothetical protein